MRTISNIFLFLFVMLLTTCSNSEEEYNKVKKLQEDTEKSVAVTNDYDLKIQYCDNVISFIEQFLNDRKQDSFTDAASIDLKSWQTKRISFLEELDSLNELLYQRMAQRATVEAKNHHLGSNIEEIKLDTRNTRKGSNKIIVDDIYSVKMRGKFFGKNVFNFKINVTGYIATDIKDVAIENVIIEE